MADNSDQQELRGDLPNYGEVLASWEYAEFEQHARGRWWYIVALTIVVLVLMFAYFDANYLLASIVVIAIIIFAVSEWRGPSVHTFMITEDGLVVEDKFFKYRDLNNFFIIYQPPDVKMLYFDPKSVLIPHIGIPLGTEDPNRIRELLLNYLPEDLDKEEEPTSDYWGRILKF